MFEYLVAYIVILAISMALAPKNKQEGMKPGEFKAPTAEEGREIPVLFGTRDITAPNVVWYGDVTTKAIRKKGGKK